MADSVYDVAVDSAVLSQCLSVEVQNEIQVFTGRFSGGVDPQMRAVNRDSSKAIARTADLATLLATVSLANGLSIGGDGGLILPWNGRQNGGTFEETAYTLSSTQAFAYITEIMAQQNSEEGAVGLVDIIPTWDGSTLPFVSNSAQTLAAQAFIAAYGLGPVKIGSTAIGQVTGVSIKPGIALLTPSYNGNVFIDACYINLRDPQVTITFESQKAVHDFGAMFSALGSNLVVYLRKRAAGGTFVANGTAQHIALTLSGGLSTTPSISGQGSENSEKQLTLYGHTLASSSSSAISPGS